MLYKNIVLLAQMLQANRELLFPWWNSLRSGHSLGHSFKKYFYSKLLSAAGAVAGHFSLAHSYWITIWLSVFRGYFFYQAFSNKTKPSWRFDFPLAGFTPQPLKHQADKAKEAPHIFYGQPFYKTTLPLLPQAALSPWKPKLSGKLLRTRLSKRLEHHLKYFAREQQFVKFYLQNKGKIKFRKTHLKKVAYSIPKQHNKSRKKTFKRKLNWKIDFEYLSVKPKVSKEDVIFALNSKL
jgi:hypothetical protein